MIISHSPAETFAAGCDRAIGAQGGDVFALIGDLGAGKTQWVKGFVRGLGSEQEATSPTFTLVHEYGGGRLPVYHFDFYRLESAAAASRLGLDEYLFGDGASVIEWADRFPELIPEGATWIRLASRGETVREIMEGVIV